MHRSSFRQAIARRPGANAGDGLTTADLGQADVARMRAQHEAYLRALASLGVDVVVLEADERFPDGCFVEDVAVVTDDCTVIARPGALSRRGEVNAIEPLLPVRGAVARIEAPGCLDGGDVVIAGSKAFVGLSQRTNAAGAEQLAAILSSHGMQTRAIPVAAGLHLKSHVNWLGNDLLIVTAAYAQCQEFADFRLAVVAGGEEYAANCLVSGNRAIVPAGFPRTAELLAREGYSPLPLDVSEFRKMDGGLSCLSIRFDNVPAEPAAA